MQYRYLSDSDIEVSELTLGMWNFADGDMWGEQEEQEAIDTIHAAIERGVTTFDNAEQYGDGYAEELLGDALSEYDRDEFVISTKAASDNLGRDDLKRACERSLERMNTDYVDVYYLHWPNRDVPIEESLRGLAELKEEGKIREAAVSNFGPEDLSELFEVAREKDINAEPVVNQLPYSLLWRTIEEEIVPLCEEYEVSVASYSSLMHGLLADKFDSPDDVPEGRARTRHFSGDRPQARHDEAGAEEETFETLDRIREICEEEGIEMSKAAIRWNLTRPQVDTVIAGARSPEQVRENVDAVELTLSEEATDSLTEVTEGLKQTLGPNPDLWESDSRYR